MKKSIIMFIIMIIITNATMISVYSASEIDIHVAVTGSDTNGNGTLQNPYATLAQAKIAVAALEKNAKINVMFHGGKYCISSCITFDASDSGTASYPISYRAYGDGNVVFSGSSQLNNDKFEKVSDVNILRRIPSSARSSVVQLNLSEQGISYNDILPVLYSNDKQQTIARYPNSDFCNATNASGNNSFIFDYEGVTSWNPSNNVQLVGNFTAGYVWNTATITHIQDKTLTLSTKIRKNTKFYVRNLIEELDAPGEYIIDNNILYYYPISNIKNLNLEIITYTEKSMIAFNNVSNISFNEITFEKSLSSAFRTNTEISNIKISNCNFKFLINQYVLYISGSDCTISDNYAYGCGGSFIFFSGGKLNNLVPGNIIIKNNRIVSCGNWYMSKNVTICSGENSEVQTSSVGNTVINNIIQDCNSSSAISVVGNNNMVKYNEIFNQGRIIDDGGAIYFGKSNTKYGNEVSNNYIHDLNTDSYYCGLYSDDGYGGLNMHHNILVNMAYGIISGVGMNNKFNNNMMINCKNGLELGTRMTWQPSVYGPKGSLYSELDLILNRTISTVSNVFKKQYPDFNVALTRTPYFAPWNTEITGNVSFGTSLSLHNIPCHLYHTSDGELTIEGEDNVSNISDALFKLSHNTYVDELKAYGAKIKDISGNDLNGTILGNPNYPYQNDYFVDSSKQNFNLKPNFSSEVSSVNDIDMSLIGIINTTNKNIFKKSKDKLTLYDVAYDSEKAIIAWEQVEKASEYRVIISQSATLDSPIIDNTISKSLSENYFTFPLESEKTYYYKVIAKGNSMLDTFNYESEIKTFNTIQLKKDNLNNAISLLETDINNVKNGKYYYDDNYFVALQQNLKDFLKKASMGKTQKEIDNTENEINQLLSDANLNRKFYELKITRFEPDQNSSKVYIEGVGFQSDSLVSILVTNPSFLLSDAFLDKTTNTIQFADIISTDSNGTFAFSFDTKKHDIDYSGEYNIYLTNSSGVKIQKKYIYGTVEIGAITIKNSKGYSIDAPDIINYIGDNITINCEITNRTSKSLTPNIFICSSDNNILNGVTFSNTDTILANEKKEIQVSFKVPSIYSSNCILNFMIWDEINIFRPLTKVKVIYEQIK